MSETNSNKSYKKASGPSNKQGGYNKSKNFYDPKPTANKKSATNPKYSASPSGSKPAYGSRTTSASKESYGSKTAGDSKPSYGSRTFGGSRESYGSKAAGDSKPSYGSRTSGSSRESYGSKASGDSKPSYGSRTSGGSRESYGSKAAGDSKPSYGSRTSGGSRESYGSKASGDSKPSYGSRTSGGSRESYGSKAVGDSKPSYGSRTSGGSRESYGSKAVGDSKPSYGSRTSGGSRESYGSKAAGDSKPSYGSKTSGGSRESYGSKAAGDSKPSYGSRTSGSSRESYGSKAAGDTKPSYGSRTSGSSRKSYGSKASGDSKPSYGSRTSGSSRESYGSKAAGDSKPSYGSKTSGSSRESYGSKTGSGSKETYSPRNSGDLKEAYSSNASNDSKVSYGKETYSSKPYNKEKDQARSTSSDRSSTGRKSNSKEKYGKNDQSETYEDIENFNTFIKATGWKSHGTNAPKGHGNSPKSNDSSKDSNYGSQRKTKQNGTWESHDYRSNERSNVDGTRDSSRVDNRRERAPIPKGSCPYLRECGSCNIMRVSYDAHLTEKQKTVDNLLKKYCKVEPIIRMEEPNSYRHKVHVVFDHDRKGTPISGVYEEGSHRVVAIDRCLIHNEKADAIIASIRGMLKSFKILTYDEDTGYGLMRHVLIRTGLHSGEIMVVLVLGSPIMPSKNNFVKALLKEHPEITTIIVNVNDKKTSMVLGDKEQVIYGIGTIEDSLCGKTFRISPKSFYQVNPIQTEVLYNKAMELALLTGTETVIDAYCGIGTIGLIASDHANKVIGVELNKDAVRDAVLNAKRNEATNIEFYNNDAGVFLSQMVEKGETADVVFMDPPRTGSNPQFMDAVAAMKPKKIVYISCNPITLERDLEYITKKGYKAEIAVPVDMFPWTGHVETVVLLSKKVQ